jgi:hypothetical protein
VTQDELTTEDLELNVETYDSISGNREFWNVQIDRNFDLLIYKKINNSWSNQTTVRFREGNHDFTESQDLAEYFLANLKSNFPSLLHLKSRTNNTYSGAAKILKILTNYLSAGEMKDAELKIGKRKYKLLSNLSGGAFFAKPSISRSIKRNECVMSAEDHQHKIALIWHKNDDYIIQKTEAGKTFYEIARNDAGFLVNKLMHLILELSDEVNLKKYVKKYVLDNLSQEDYLENIPNKVKICDKYDGATLFNFKIDLTGQEAQLWRMLSTTNNPSVVAAECHIDYVVGIKSEQTFKIKRESDVSDWIVDWSGEVELLNFKGPIENQTLFEILLSRHNELKDFDVKINTSGNAGVEQVEQVELWLKALNLVLDEKS